MSGPEGAFAGFVYSTTGLFSAVCGGAHKL